MQAEGGGCRQKVVELFVLWFTCTWLMRLGLQSSCSPSRVRKISYSFIVVGGRWPVDRLDLGHGA